ncbi:tyrosine--tRNA ligase [Thermoproteota archaeon]
MKTLTERFLRGIQEIIPESAVELIKQVKKPLKIKFGADPSAPDLHLGHMVVLNKLRLLQEMGHRVQFVIGDFTARIGDPTGRSETRVPLTHQQIKTNAKTYQEQIFKILDKLKTDIFYNSIWLDKLTAQDMIELSAKYTVARMLERDDFNKRYNNNQSISIHEFLYPLLQGYDSVELESDVEIGGTDQTFNLLVGRHLQKEFGKKLQAVITCPILEGLDGVQKMSKSLNNHIGLCEEPGQIFGKIMSVADDMIIKYYELLTDVSDRKIKLIKEALDSGSENPRDIKADLAEHIVGFLHSHKAGKDAREEFDRIFSERKTPVHIPEIEVPKGTHVRLDQFLTDYELAPSKKEAFRLIKQGAVDVNGSRADDPFQEYKPEKGHVIKVGKRRFVQVKLI